MPLPKRHPYKITDALILCSSLLRAFLGSSAFFKFSWKCGRPVKLVYHDCEVKPIMNGFWWAFSNFSSNSRLTKYWIEVHRRLRSGLAPTFLVCGNRSHFLYLAGLSVVLLARVCRFAIATFASVGRWQIGGPQWQILAEITWALPSMEVYIIKIY